MRASHTHSSSCSSPTMKTGCSSQAVLNSSMTLSSSSPVDMVSVLKKQPSSPSPCPSGYSLSSQHPSNRQARVTSWVFSDTLTERCRMHSLRFLLICDSRRVMSLSSARSSRALRSLLSTWTVLLRWSLMLSWVYSSSFLISLRQRWPLSLFLKFQSCSEGKRQGDFISLCSSLVILFSNTRQLRMALLQLWAASPASPSLLFSTISLRASRSKKYRMSRCPRILLYTFSMVFLWVSSILCSFSLRSFCMYSSSCSGSRRKGRKTGVDIYSILIGRGGSCSSTEGSTYLFLKGAQTSEWSRYQKISLQPALLLLVLAHILATRSKSSCSWREQVAQSLGLTRLAALSMCTKSFCVLAPFWLMQGCSLVMTSNMMTPREQMSESQSATQFCSVSFSRGMQWRVPSLVRELLYFQARMEKPKSVILSTPFLTRTLASLRSWWTIPAFQSTRYPSSSWQKIEKIAYSCSSPCFLTISVRVPSGQSSMNMQKLFSEKHLQGRTLTRLLWSGSSRRISTSFYILAFLLGSPPQGMILTARGRPWFLDSAALLTTPKPPSPSLELRQMKNSWSSPSREVPTSSLTSSSILFCKKCYNALRCLLLISYRVCATLFQNPAQNKVGAQPSTLHRD